MKGIFVGKYRITTYGNTFLWRWYLLPTIGFAFDRRSYYFDFHFLPFSFHIALENVIEVAEWEKQLDRKFKDASDVQNPF